MTNHDFDGSKLFENLGRASHKDHIKMYSNFLRGKYSKCFMYVSMATRIPHGVEMKGGTKDLVIVYTKLTNGWKPTNAKCKLILKQS